MLRINITGICSERGILVWWVAVIAVLVVGCQPAVSATMTLAPSETSTATASATVIPSTSTPTSVPTATSYPTPGPDYSAFYFGDVLESPDGNWVAINTSEADSDDGRANIKVYDQAGTLLWTVASDIREEQKEFYPYKRVILHHWAPDSSSIYYYYNICCPSGPEPLTDGFDLTEFDIFTGEEEAILPAGEVDFSYSPQHSKLAYIFNDPDPKEIVVRDLSTGTERKAKLTFGDSPDYQAGWINWAKDGKSLIFVTQALYIEFKIYYLDLENMKPNLIYEDKEVDWIDGVWVGENSLEILTFANVGIFIEIDMSLGEVVGVVPYDPDS